MQLSDHAGKVVADVGFGVAASSTLTVWLSTFDLLLKITLSVVAIVAGVASYRYYTAKRRVLEKQHGTDISDL